MGKILVAYFSASGVTADAAKSVADAVHGDLYAIQPAVPYTAADLNWEDPNSRSSVEMKDKAFRPAMKDKDAAVTDYDTILLGFPIWWYTAPTIINTFLESYDFSDKKIILFATSGSSGFENTLTDLKKSVGDTTVITEGVVVHGKQDDAFWKDWVKTLGL